jgi:hypothetical protein
MAICVAHISGSQQLLVERRPRSRTSRCEFPFPLRGFLRFACGTAELDKMLQGLLQPPLLGSGRNLVFALLHGPVAGEKQRRVPRVQRQDRRLAIDLDGRELWTGGLPASENPARTKVREGELREQ